MNSQIPRIEIKPGYSISRIIKGGWHLAGGHGTMDKKQAIEDMRAFVEAGITTFDCADIYSGVEELIGNFISHYKEAFASGDLPPIQIHTKYVPDYDRLAALTKLDTQAAIDRSLVRLGVERLDMVQFAWWDYAIPGHLETALHLTELRKAGKIRHLAVTNVDAAHLRELLEAGVEVVANQVQYSVLDHRPAGDLVKLAREHGVWILCYGVVAGGFLSDRYAMVEGDCFHMRGGKISLPDGADFCLYALQATLPILPAKQRRCHPADWMESDSHVACPDPACRLGMRIDRTGLRVLNHDDVSATAWDSINQQK